MYRLLYLLFPLLLPGCSGDATRDQDSFGFSIGVPDNWIVLSRQEVRDNPDLFDGLSIEGVSPDIIKEFRNRVESGSIEIYFRQEDGITSFADNVNVIKQVQVLPETPADLKKFHEAFPGEFEKALGKPVELYESRFAEVADRNAIFIEFEGVVPNTRSMQYQIAKSENVSLIFTATCKEATLQEVRPEFEAMIKSIRFR